MKIKSLFKKMVDAEKKLDAIEKEWEANPNNEKMEDAWSKQYDITFDATTAVAKEIETLIGVKPSIARSMIFSKRAELESLINRIA